MSTEIYVKGSGGNGLLSALPWTANHTALTGNPYLAGTLVYDGGNIYKCLITNDSIPTWNPFFWSDLGPGFILSQEKPDWNATSGDSQILNKPTIPDVSGFVPYTGANQNVDLGTYNLTADHITLNVNPSGAGFVVGTTQWNNTDGTSQTLLKGGNVILKNGVDLVARVINNTGINLTRAAYQVVKVSGAQGQRLAVGLAQGNNDLGSADTLGLVIENINNNQEGFIMTVGQLLDVNTTGSLQGETWNDGDVLYLSPTIAGAVTNIKPTGLTGHIVVLGYVEYSHSNQGKIYVKIMNGWELDELHNVYINTGTLLNNNLLTYESSSQLWKNKSIGQVIGGNASQYLRGDGTIASFPDVSGGGGGQVYYFNGNTSQGTISGNVFEQLSVAAQFGANSDFTSGTVNGVAFANFITDVNKPTQETVPAGVWIFQCYLSSTANTTQVYATVEVYNGTTFTVLGTSLNETITNGSTIDLYTFLVGVPQYDPLLTADRIAIRFYPANLGGTNTITLHTENNHLSSVQTTFSTGLAALDGLSAAAQYLQVGTTGTNFNITTSGSDTHIFNLPTSSAINRGALSSSDWSTFNNKIGGSGTVNYISKFTAVGTIGNSLIQDNGTTLSVGVSPSIFYKLAVIDNTRDTGIFGSGSNTGLYGNGNLYGVYGLADNYLSTTGVGVKGEAIYSGETIPPVVNIGGQFIASSGTNNYAVQLQDGSEGNNKFLKSVTTDGKANWANITVADTGLTLTTTGSSGAATLVGNTLNIPQYTGGSGSATLSQVLTNGNSAGTTDINMNNNNILNIATVSANNGPQVQMINMTNAVNMLLMYNS